MQKGAEASQFPVLGKGGSEGVDEGAEDAEPTDQWVVDMVEPRGPGLGSQEGVVEQDEWRWRADAHRGFVCSERFGGWQQKRVLRQDGDEVFRGTRGSKARC